MGESRDSFVVAGEAVEHARGGNLQVVEHRLEDGFRQIARFREVVAHGRRGDVRGVRDREVGRAGQAAVPIDLERCGDDPRTGVGLGAGPLA